MEGSAQDKLHWLFQQRSYKTEMLENLEERWQQGFISEGQTVCQTCYLAKSQAEQEVLKVPSSSSSDIVWLTNQMTHGHINVQGKKPASSDAGEFCLDDRVKKTALKEHLKHRVWLGPGLTKQKSIPRKALIHKAPSKMMCTAIPGGGALFSNCEIPTGPLSTQRVKPLTMATVTGSSSQIKSWSCWNRC